MSIIHMCSKPEDAPGGAFNLTDVSDQYRSSISNTPYSGETQEQADARVARFSLWIYETHVGLCLFESEVNGRDDSDFYMTVWNPEKQQPERIQFATTRGWCGPCFGSHADATPEVQAAYAEYQRKQAEAARKLHQERLDAMPSKGKTLRVVKGRNVPVGTEGPCFWSSTQFKRDRVLGVLFLGYVGRVGIETSAGRVFTDVGNVEVVLK